MATNTEIRRTIKIKQSTYDEIKRLGYMGETFDQVLQRMLQFEKLIKRKQTETEKQIRKKL